MKGLLYVFAGIVIAPYVILIGIFIRFTLFLVEVWTRVAFWYLRHRQAGAFFLVCTRRRGWYEFLNNNLIPVLPHAVRVVWHVKNWRGKSPPISEYLRRSGI